MNRGQSAGTPAENDLHLQLFRNMLRVRTIEEAIARHYAEGQMRCPVHLSVGQEAVAVGTAAAIRQTDLMVSTHRGHAHYLAKGGDLTAMLAEMLGRSTGCSKGRGGSMNLRDEKAGVMLTLPIVASSIPLGVGLALAERQRGSDRIVCVYLGDAAVEEGVFHESANFASLQNLPVVFFLENNLYSVYTPLAKRQPPRPLENVAVAHGIRSYSVNGNDVVRVYEASVEAVQHSRASGGPALLVFDTYRWLEHCGPNFDNHIGYRTEAEFQDWKRHCPLAAMREALGTKEVLDESAERRMREEIELEFAEAYRAALAAPFPASEDAKAYVYA